MGTLQGLRKAYGALKDSTTVGLAKVNSEFKDLDIAIVKATNHSEGPPKERYVRKIFHATSIVRPRSDIAYCIHALSRRLAKTRNWKVALKTLIVIHRTLREGDPIFRDELLNYSRRGQILQISNFKDDSSPLAWDCSAWVRSYALFLEERLECFRILKYDVEAERFMKSAAGVGKEHSRTRDLGCDDLLEQLPALQQLLYRLIGCHPEGGAFHNYLILYALTLVLKESFKIYCAMNDGIINLVDLFFDMSRHDAVKSLNIYKRAGHQAQSLSDFYELCKGLELARNFQFPTLRQPPPSFLATMEEYIREAPCTGSVSNQRLEYQERDLIVTCKPAEASPPESPRPTVEDDSEQAEETQEPPPTKIEVASQPLPAADTGDLLGLNEINPDAAALEERNALALAIVPPGDDSKSSTAHGLPKEGLDASGWELALVTTPSSNSSHLSESKLAGGFNKLLLDSLYDSAEARKQQNVENGVVMGANPFTQQDPFFMSNGIAPPPNVQMAFMAQQQQQCQQHMMSTMMIPHPYPNHHLIPQQQQQPQMGSTNPFEDPFTGFLQSRPQGNPSLL